MKSNTTQTILCAALAKISGTEEFLGEFDPLEVGRLFEGALTKRRILNLAKGKLRTLKSKVSFLCHKKELELRLEKLLEHC